MLAATLLVAWAVQTPLLQALVAALQKAPAWQAAFTQAFAPAGFSTSTEEKGVVTFSHPSRVRFDYTSAPHRIFAVDGSEARMLDGATGSCQAWSLGEGAWAALPLAALTDPGALRQLYSVRQQQRRLVLQPHKPMIEVARLEVAVGSNGLPEEVVVEDAQGNRNRFRFTGWRQLETVPSGFFAPSPSGGQACASEPRL